MVESLELGITQRSETAPLKTEADLTFILARAAVTRWRFETERLRRLAKNWSPAKRGLALMESELGLAQIKALVDRIGALTESRNMAVRFEAQETLVALNSVGERLSSILDEVREEKSRRNVDGIKAAVFAPIRLRPTAAGGRRGRATSADSGKGRPVPKRQATRFETRYIEHLIGRAPRLVATQNVTVAPPPADDDAAFERAVRETAYLLWEEDGRPEGRADEYWQRALEIHRSERVPEEAEGAEDSAGNPPPPQQLRMDTELSSPFPEPGQDVYDAFAELAATLGRLCDAPEVPEVGARAAYPRATPLRSAES